MSPIAVAGSGPAWAQFNEDAFVQGAGFTAVGLTSVITGVTFVLAAVGLAWIAMSTFRTWADGRSSLGGLGVLLFRALALLTVITVLLR
ncbi:MAG: DUF3262 family protein [Geminicoccaceae bacterium]